MNDLVEFIKSFDLHTIIVVGIAFLWLNSSMNTQFKELDQKINNLTERVSKIEGLLCCKGYCFVEE